MEKFSVTVLFILVALVGFARADFASPPETQSHGAIQPGASVNAPPGLVVGQTATIQGLVRFEEHHTIIPFWCSPQALGPCARSRPYWSVIIYTDSNQFEIDERFALDQSSAPDSVQLDGQPVRSGQVVRVDATVEYAGSNYYILGDVRNVNLVLDYSTVSLPNWSCHGMVDRDTEIEAQVWYTGAQGGSEGNHYALHLAGAENQQEGQRVFSLAELSDAQGFTSRNQLVYQGADAHASVELVIDHTPDVISEGVNAQVPGRLKFNLSEAPNQHSRIQAQGDFPVVCGRTR